MIGINWRQVAAISFTILLFHVIMPLAGWYLGGIFGSLVGKLASVIGALVLIFLGGKMIWESCRKNAGSEISRESLSGWGIFLLAAGVSMDALSVGFSLGTRQVGMLAAAGTIGLVAGLMTFTGLQFGQILGGVVGKRAQVVGGIILAGIGVRMLLT